MPNEPTFEVLDGRKTMILTRGNREPNHGRVTLYGQGCRCAVCTEAQRIYRAVFQQGQRLARTRAGAIPETVKHGTGSTYTNWGCRCEPCVAAGARANKSYYDRVLSKEARGRRARNAYTVGYIDGSTGVVADPEKGVDA